MNLKVLKRLSKDERGVLDLADPILLGFSGLALYIAILIFLPFADLLSTATENMTNSGVFMSIVYIIPIVMGVLIIIGFVNKAKEPR